MKLFVKETNVELVVFRAMARRIQLVMHVPEKKIVKVSKKETMLTLCVCVSMCVRREYGCCIADRSKKGHPREVCCGTSGV